MQKMRKLATVIAAFLLSSASLHAQDDTNMFNHMALGVTAGTPGVGLELAMPMGNYVQVRAGATYMPQFSVNTTFCLTYGPPSAVLVVSALATFCAMTSARARSAIIPETAISRLLKNAICYVPLSQLFLIAVLIILNSELIWFMRA